MTEDVKAGSGQPLAGLKVVELSGLPAASYAARLMADFGAEVIRVEPPRGDPQRKALPQIDGISAWFAYLNYGKTSVSAEDPALAALLASADVLVTSGPQRTPATGARVHLHVDWFGDGPYARLQCTDSVCRALAGAIFLTGPKEGPPLAIADFQSGIIGGLAGVIPALAALLAADGKRRRVDASVHEATVAVAEYQAVEMRAGVVPRQRFGLNRFLPTYPLGIYPCKEGWLGVTIVTPTQWRIFCDLLGMADLGRHSEYVMGPERLPRADQIEARFLPRLKEKTAAEWFALGLEHRLPFTQVPDMAQVLSWPTFRQRGAIVPIRIGERTVEAPGTPFHLTRTPPHHGGAVPREIAPLRPSGTSPLRREGNDGDSARPFSLPGAEPTEVARPSLSQPVGSPEVARPSFSLPPAGGGGRRPGGDVSTLPLTGLRVVDLSMGWAGPTVTRHLADMGADIIKVEACGYPDWWRGTDNRPAVIEQLLYEKTLRFNIMNRNKRAITLDLTEPDGVRLLKDLVRDAAAVVENYSADVLPRLGLDYAALSAVNPSLVMLSMNAYGASSPWRDCRAYGSTLEQGSGLPSLNGRPGDPPVKNHLAYGDPIGGMNGVAALLVGLLHRQRTGQGQHIDLSQIECMLPFTAVSAMLQSAYGSAGARLGNRHPEHAPHGIYRCDGEDRWLLIDVVDDTAWQALAGAISRPDLGDDSALADAAGRQADHDRIDAAIANWAREQDADTAMQVLQRAGVAAGVVRTPGELFEDPQLAARGFWQFIDRPHIGRHPQPSSPYRFDGAERPLPVRWAAGTLGQFNAEVLGEVLKLDAAALADLERRGIIGSKAVPPAQRKARAAAL